MDYVKVYRRTGCHRMHVGQRGAWWRSFDASAWGRFRLGAEMWRVFEAEGMYFTGD